MQETNYSGTTGRTRGPVGAMAPSAHYVPSQNPSPVRTECAPLSESKETLTEADPDHEVAGAKRWCPETGEEICGSFVSPADMLPERFPLARDLHYLLPRTCPLPSLQPFPVSSPWENQERAEPEPELDAPDESSSRSLLYWEPDVREKTAAVDRFAALSHRSGSEEAGESSEADRQDTVVALPLPAPVPAWLNGPDDPDNPKEIEEERGQGLTSTASPVRGTLQSLHEHVASRRFVSRAASVAEDTARSMTAVPGALNSSRIPLLALFSLSGGAGKTSLVATLGRALASLGERVLLADTTPQGLLPFFFSLSEPRMSGVQTIVLPIEASAAPIDLLSLDVCRENSRSAQEWLRSELSHGGKSAGRILLDTSAHAPWVIRLLARMNATMLVPVAPDMNSVMTLEAVEAFFADMENELGQAVQPSFLMNGFDASQSLHLDVRELLRQRLGDRLLPFVIRRSPAVPEALAEGMTVVDYAAGTAVAADYADAAAWVKAQTGGMPRVFQDAQWSEA